jgi:hypothetical protein
LPLEQAQKQPNSYGDKNLQVERQYHLLTQTQTEVGQAETSSDGWCVVERSDFGVGGDWAAITFCRIIGMESTFSILPKHH